MKFATVCQSHNVSIISIIPQLTHKICNFRIPNPIRVSKNYISIIYVSDYERTGYSFPYSILLGFGHIFYINLIHKIFHRGSRIQSQQFRAISHIQNIPIDSRTLRSGVSTVDFFFKITTRKVIRTSYEI